MLNFARLPISDCRSNMSNHSTTACLMSLGRKRTTLTFCLLLSVICFLGLSCHYENCLNDVMIGGDVNNAVPQLQGDSLYAHQQHQVQHFGNDNKNDNVGEAVKKEQSDTKVVDTYAQHQVKHLGNDNKSYNNDNVGKAVKKEQSDTKVVDTYAQHQVKHLGNDNKNYRNDKVGKAVKKEQSDTKVIVVTYMRSGSTFVGDILNKSPDVVYWFEPGMGLYSDLYNTMEEVYPIDLSHYPNGTSRTLPSMEHEYLREKILSLLSCDYKNVPVDAVIEYRGLDDFNWIYNKQYKTCLERTTKISVRTLWKEVRKCHELVKKPCDIADFAFCHNLVDAVRNNNSNAIEKLGNSNNKYSIEQFRSRHECISKLEHAKHSCASHIENMCKSNKVKVIKMIRLSMATIEIILDKHPDIKVIHLLRDPRGILNSRRKTIVKKKPIFSRVMNSKHELQIIVEAKSLCEKMANDIKIRKRLEQKYTNNFLEVRYEDVAKAPYTNYMDIYSFVGLSKSSVVENWIYNTTHTQFDSHTKVDQFRSQRNNATAVAYRWQQEVIPERIQKIATICQDVLVHLNYTVYS